MLHHGEAIGGFKSRGVAHGVSAVSMFLNALMAPGPDWAGAWLER